MKCTVQRHWVHSHHFSSSHYHALPEVCHPPQLIPHSSFPSLWEPLFYLLSLGIWLFHVAHITEIIQYLSFCVQSFCYTGWVFSYLLTSDNFKTCLFNPTVLFFFFFFWWSILSFLKDINHLSFVPIKIFLVVCYLPFKLDYDILKN